MCGTAAHECARLTPHEQDLRLGRSATLWINGFQLNANLPENVTLTDRDTIKNLFAVPGVIRWEELAGEVRLAWWKQLRVFVEWWADRYHVTERILPGCWYRHSGIVEELTALMSARTASFSDVDQGLGPIGWHERAALVRSRLETIHYRGECQNGHRDAIARAPINAEDWAAHITTEARILPAPLTPAT